MADSAMPHAPGGRRRKKSGRTWLRRGLLGVAALFTALLLALLGAFGYLQFESQQAVTLPTPTGSYQVGRTIYQWTDHTRRDPFSPNGHSPVEISVWTWYPASVPRGSQRAAYMPSTLAQGSDSFLQTRPQDVRAHAWSGVPVAATGRPFPVLVFMPGFGKVVANYTTLMEDLASRGYVVFAITPPYISDDVVLNGRLVPENRRLHAEEENAPSVEAQSTVDARVVAVEADDMRFVLDKATVLNRTVGGRFSGRLTTLRAGFLGHSIGGAAALEACEIDPQCVGAANLDGEMAGPVLTQGVHKPFLYLGEDPSISPPPMAPLRGVARGLPADDVHVFTMTGAGHMNFTDLGVLWKIPPNQLGTIGPIAGGRALAITQAYVSSFFTSELTGRPSPLLSTVPPKYGEVQVIRGVA